MARELEGESMIDFQDPYSSNRKPKVNTRVEELLNQGLDIKTVPQTKSPPNNGNDLRHLPELKRSTNLKHKYSPSRRTLKEINGQKITVVAFANTLPQPFDNPDSLPAFDSNFLTYIGNVKNSRVKIVGNPKDFYKTSIEPIESNGNRLIQTWEDPPLKIK